jgi:mitochondrial fission protein ELM1
MPPAELARRLPRVWILLAKGVGGNAQMFNLADALGWPCERKRVVYNRLERLPNLLLGDSSLSVDRKKSDALEPPWPDLVIAASRRSAPVARWIRKQSGGRTRLVHLIHTMAPLDRFDLIITTPQCCLPELPNILHNVGPLNRPDLERLRSAGEQWLPRLGELPRPFVVLLVGGNSSTYELDAESAARLGREASALARDRGGSLLVSTSPRTPAAAADALCRAIDVPSYVYRWKRDDPDNPYAAFLALADSLIVTVDSASQLVEACATGKPVHLFEWPMRPRTRSGYKGFLRRWRERARQQPATPGSRLYALLLHLGLIKPPRDFTAFHRALERRGLLERLGAEAPAVPRRPLDDLERAVERVRALFPA